MSSWFQIYFYYQCQWILTSTFEYIINLEGDQVGKIVSKQHLNQLIAFREDVK